MTGYTVHTGSGEAFSSGWDRVFGGKVKAKSKAGKTLGKASPSKAAKDKAANTSATTKSVKGRKKG